MSTLQLCNESRNHLFFDCSYSGLVWRLISDRCQLQFTSSWEDVIQQIHASPRNKDLRRLTLLAVQGTIYWLWHERNTRLHEQTFRTAEAIFSTLDKQLRNRVQSFRHTNPRASTAMMQLWFLRSSFPSSVPFPHRNSLGIHMAPFIEVGRKSSIDMCFNLTLLGLALLNYGL